MNRNHLFLFFGTLLFWSSCLDNGLNIDPFAQRGEVTGSWLPLQIGDTLDVYVNRDNNIHIGDPSLEITQLPEAQASTFQVWTDSNYARDSVNVYFPIEIICEVIDELYSCYSTKYLVEGANASEFRYLGNGFATDGNELFLNGIIVRGNNGEGF